MDVDRIFRMLGNPGRHHVITFLLLCTCYFPVVLNHLSMVIYGSAVPHHCAIPDGYNRSDAIPWTATDGRALKLDSCHVYENFNWINNKTVPCPNGWEYDPLPRERNIVMEFDLVCDRSYLSNVATTVYFLGVMLGGLVFGSLSDIYGRKLIFLSSLYLQVIIALALVLVHNYITFIILRFFLGFLLQGLHTCCYVLIMEQSLPEHRTYTGTIVEVFWGVGVVWLAIISYTLQDWRHIQLAISLPSVLTVAFIWLIPESVRWLVTQGRLSEAERILRKMAKCNGATLPDTLFSGVQNQAGAVDNKIASEDECKSVRHYNVVDMLRTPQLRKRSLVLFYIWFAMAVCYYGLSLAITSLSGNKFLNLLMCGLVELPAYITAIFILKWFGRKYPLCVYLMIGGSTCLAAAFVPRSLSWVRTLLAVIGRAGVAGVFTVMILYSCELYPTVIRNLGVGMCAFWARVGGVVAPQVLVLGTIWSKSVPLVIFGILSLLGSFTSLLLPETLGKPLPDTIDQAEQIGDDPPTDHHPGSGQHLLEPLQAVPMDRV
ncbi:Organic cation transporter protein [Lamellibrachia satsuma]|nr:Organic cation transporter protein [Lamellibrachia satsuma]